MHLTDLDVTDVATGGDGIAHAPDGRVVFVAGGIPGERVTAEVVAEERRFLRARVSTVDEPSPTRVKPFCPHVADGCGGCRWQDRTVAGQRAAKVRIAEESMRRLGHHEGTVEIGPDLAPRDFRTTLRLVAADGRLAFRAAASHESVPVVGCDVAVPGLADLLDSVDWSPVDDDTEVVLRASAATGDRLVVVEGGLPEALVVPDGVFAVGSHDLAAGGSVSLVEEVAGHRLRVSANAFFQTRVDGAEALVAAVRELGGDRWGSGRLVDLYGGVGLFAVTLGAGMEVTVVEANPASASDAQANLARASVDGRVLAIPAERWRPEAADVIIADPPRAGLDRSVVDAVTRAAPEVLVTVHCDAASFGRDVGRLTATGWRRSRTMLVDLFPHTPHVELVSSFYAG